MKGIDMFPSPMDFSEALHIGTVEFVSPNEIRVSLDIEAPESVALNTGTPRPFPRVNGYVLIPSDQGYLVGQIEWLTIEESAYPKRRGLKDFGLIDLPYPKRKMSLNPLGDLIKKTDDKGDESYQFERGVESFPSVGDAVLLPTETQLHSIVESGQERKVKIGTSPLAGDAEVFVDPDRLFGRHLAVLGNTGSGKSCSVAGLIRWSLQEANNKTQNPNARFIVLDPNGEYMRAFGETEGPMKPRVFSVSKDLEIAKQLAVPLWFWNSAEWGAFTQASGKTQKPLLRRALRDVKAGKKGILENEKEKRKLYLRRYLTSKVISIRRDLKNGAIQTEETKFGFRLKATKLDLQSKISLLPNLNDEITAVITKLDTAISETQQFYMKEGTQIEYFRAFTEELVENILNSMVTLLGSIGGIIIEEGPSEDIPLCFSGEDLIDHLAILAEEEGVTQYIDFLTMRIRTLLSDTRMKSIISDEGNVTLGDWLENYIGGNQEGQGCISIIDLSLVPSEIIHIVTAVIARMTFDALQRYRKYEDAHKVLPTVLVMEEAHTYVKRYRDDIENQSTAAVCCKVFERIAREGRKFGLGLVLSSQRPSELSPTVLSQCNSFLLHRISNDRDQDLVNRYVPDNLRGLLNDLPSLPSQNAILLGWASELPVLVRMNDLPKNQQPQSDDPDFWDVWTGKKERNVDWNEIADIWQLKNGE
jgi:hypothetical protein